MNTDWKTVLMIAGQAASRQDFAGAEAILRKVVNQPDTPPAALFQLGKILFVQRKVNDAIECFRKAAVAAPQVFDGWFELGRALGAAERYEEALPALRKASDLAPNHAETHRFAANVARAVRDFQAAAFHFARLRALQPSDASAWVEGYAASLEARDPEAEALRAELMANEQTRGRCLELTVRCSAGRIPLR